MMPSWLFKRSDLIVDGYCDGWDGRMCCRCILYLLGIGKKTRKRHDVSIFIDSRMHETRAFANLASNIYLLICYFLLFELA